MMCSDMMGEGCGVRVPALRRGFFYPLHFLHVGLALPTAPTHGHKRQYFRPTTGPHDSFIIYVCTKVAYISSK